MRTVLLVTLIATCALIAQGQAAVDSLIESLSSNNGETRLAAIESIAAGQFGAETIEPVAALLDNSNQAIAGDARVALERIAGPLTVDPAAREAASEALCRAALASAKRPAQRWLLWLVSYAGGDESLPHLAPLLDNDSTFDLALFAIESIGGNEAAAMLGEWLQDAPKDRRIACINVLGNVGGAEAVAVLAREAESPDGDSGFHALLALGELGAIEAEPALWAQITTARGSEALASYLRLAGQQHPAIAAALYRKLLSLPGDPKVRCAALTGLGRTGSSDAVETIAPLLVSQRADVYGAARDALIALPGEQVERELRGLLVGADGPLKASLLDVLYSRGPVSAIGDIEDALDDSNPEVRGVAIRLLAGSASPEHEATFLEVATSGDVPLRPIALQGYLRLAGYLLAEGKDTRALAMYHRALEIATQDSERQVALRGLGSVGNPESLPYLERIDSGSALDEDIEACALAIANNIRDTDAGAARSVYRRVLRESKYVNLAQRAALALRLMGDDANIAPELGFITRWQLIGPFPNTGFDAAYPPEGEFDPDARYAGIDCATIGWQDYVIDHVRGIAELDTFLRPKDDIIAYARTVFTVPSAQKAELRLGSDDGVICWLNGERIHVNNASRKVSVDHDRIPVTLRAGENVLLLKIVQGGGGMGYCARFFGQDGRPLIVREVL